MRILPLVIYYLSMMISTQQVSSPHGKNFKISCSECHSSKGWTLDRSIYSFNHDKTKFPLKGSHIKIDCKQCHKTLVFNEAQSDCISCHNDVHQATTGSDCARCHTPVSWLVNDITGIHQISRFPLLGAHKTADCIQCHKSENKARFDVTGVNCIDCHREKYMATTKPNHPLAGFSEDCSKCHPVNGYQWEGAGFNHNFFALVQGHSTPLCTDCHKTTLYSSASRECNSCHNTDYLAAANPNHKASNFPVTCDNCHTLAPGWKPAKFDHTKFPLTLGHATPACIDCHKNGNYTNTSPDCYSCHQTDYANSTNPKHSTLSFSTVCTQCHTTNPGWNPATYAQHDTKSFPIYSGRHKGTWTTCSECHANSSNYASFTCISCHEHNKASMDSKHRGENGYSYDSASCLRCHPTGRAG